MKVTEAAVDNEDLTHVGAHFGFLTESVHKYWALTLLKVYAYFQFQNINARVISPIRAAKQC